MFNSEEEKQFLNSLVRDYKDISPYSNIKKNIILSLIKNCVENSEQKQAMQMGCSNGYETRQLATIFTNLDVLDGSSFFIEKNKNINDLKNVHFVEVLFEEMHEKINKKYDYIICSYVLEHVYDSVIILKNMSALLTDNGSIFVVVPNAMALSRQLSLAMGMINNLTDLTENDHKHGHRRVYTLETLHDDIKKAGLIVVETKGIVFKILADFQLNKLLADSFLTEQHIHAMQSVANLEGNISFSDSFFVEIKKS